MRKIGFIAGLTALSAPLAVSAQALPPPPYQGAEAVGGPGLGLAGAPSADRYGGFSHGPSAYAYAPATGAPAAQPSMGYAPSGPRLAWAGKTEPQAPTPTAPSGGWGAIARRWDTPPTAAAPQAQAWTPPTQTAADGAWRPLYPQAQNQAQVQAPAQMRTQALPTSIYDPSPAAPLSPQPPQYRQAQAQSPSPSLSAAPNPQGGPRFYSLHREYGIKPDAIPLPPQFFGPTADLSAPVTDPLARRTTIVDGQTKTVAVPDPQGDQ